MKKNIAITLVIITIAGLVFFSYSSKKIDEKNTVDVVKEAEKPILEKDFDTDIAATPNNNLIVSSDEMIEKEDAMVKNGSYEIYSAEKIAMAATGNVVLFFHASWCPSCRGLNSDIEKNVANIPAEVTILKTDYDKETELKKKYGVTTQHTLVQVNKDGELIKKWSGGSKLENLLSQLQ